MSRFPSEEEQNNDSREYQVKDILSEYWAQRVEADANDAAEKRSPSRASQDPLRVEEEDEAGVRIYEPNRNRANKKERFSPLPEEDMSEKPMDETLDHVSKAAARPDLRSMAEVLLSRFRSGKRSTRSRSAGSAPGSEEELPSFDELLWGKKPAPVRISEEEHSSPAAETAVPEEQPSPDASPAETVEIHIPEEQLKGLSVDAILSEYWGGLEDSHAAVGPEPIPRRRRRDTAQPVQEPAKAPPREPRADRNSASSQPGGLFGALSRKRPSDAASDASISAAKEVSENRAPAKQIFPEESPKPLRSASDSPAEDVLNLSVDDILSEFWAGYTEVEEPSASPIDTPRSRREASCMREEAASIPPTGAAPSAAENEAGSSRRRKLREQRQANALSPEKKAYQPAREAELPTPLEEAPSPESEPPAPLGSTEAAETFGFLRHKKREKAVSRSRKEVAQAEAAPTATPQESKEDRNSSRRRDIIDEDVEFSAMSVDDIIAEYNDILAAIPAAADAIGAEAKEAMAVSAEPTAKSAPVPPSAAPKPAGGRVSRMEEEARDMLQQMRGDSFTSRKAEVQSQSGLRRRVEETAASKEETNVDPGEPVPVPNVTAVDWSDSLRRLLGQDPAPPQPAAAAVPSRKEGSEFSSPRPARTYAIPSDEIDPRFNLSGERKSTMVFGGKELDLSADESYIPPKPSGNVGFHWVAGEEELPEKPLEKKSFFRKSSPKKAAAEPEEREHTEAYDDIARPEYAPDMDYDQEDDGTDPGAFPSFGQYLSGLISGMLVRVFGARQTQANAAGTMEDEDEELGPEVSPAAASKYYGSFVTSLRMRVRIGLVLLAVLAWISLGLPVSGALRTVRVASGLALAIQLTVLLLGLDVVTGALVNLARGRFGADSLAVLSCILTSLDALSVCFGFMGTPHMPLCLISSLSFLGVLMASLVSARGLRKALRVPAIGKRCYGVTAEADVKGRGLTLLKSLRPPKGFVRRTEEAAPDETAFNRVSPILAILALLMTLIVALAKHAFREALYILTVILCPAVPLMALLCFALPFLFGSLRIFHSGAAIAGWSGISDIGRSDNLIVTDRDLFPEGSVEIDTVRIFAEVEPETIISYAGTMICASGSDLAPCFSQLMEKNGCPMRRVEGFEYLSGGGMKGVIDGSVVLCGGLDLMRLMNVRVPYRLVGKTTVLLAVDGILCGIFNMKYEGQPQVRKALVGLIRSNRHPIFAIRDFLVTPEMLADCFEVATDGYDFPPYVDRFKISEAKPSADSKLAAVVCREGLGPLVHMADTARSLYLAVRLNLLLTVLAAMLGVFVVFIKLLSAGVVSAAFLLLFLLLWSLPVLLISAFLRL